MIGQHSPVLAGVSAPCEVAEYLLSLSIDWPLVCNAITAASAVVAAGIAAAALRTWKMQLKAQSHKEIRDQLLNALADWQWLFTDVVALVGKEPLSDACFAKAEEKMEASLRAMHRIQTLNFAYLPDDKQRGVLLEKVRAVMDSHNLVLDKIRQKSRVSYRDIDLFGQSFAVIEASAFLTRELGK